MTSPAIMASAQAPTEAQTETELQVQTQDQIQVPIEGGLEIDARAQDPAPEGDAPQANPAEPGGSSRVPSEPLVVTDDAMSPAALTDEAGTEVAQPAIPAAVTPVPNAPVPAAPIPVAPEPRAERNLQTSLLIEVETVRQDMAVTVAIFGDADSFRSGEGPVRRLSLSQNRPVARAFVLNLPPGRYAIVAWQDLNGDGRPSRSRFGLTADPIGYSRAARSARGAPSFDDAAFDLGSAGLTQRIVLKGR
jgi:uncharacterized protein (DUF2141 family)